MEISSLFAPFEFYLKNILHYLKKWCKFKL